MKREAEMKEDILEILREINPLDEIDENTKLLEDFLDSMNLLLLINELEERYKIEIPMETLNFEDFENVSSIIELVDTLKK